jgi:photosystem II stability/assembly factor-like uncharacterized protein
MPARTSSSSRDTDAGATWEAANAGLPDNPSITALAIDPRTPSTLYAGTDGGVFKSTDAGATWEAQSFPIVFRLINVFKSTDAGAIWEAAGGLDCGSRFG